MYRTMALDHHSGAGAGTILLSLLVDPIQRQARAEVVVDETDVDAATLAATIARSVAPLLSCRTWSIRADVYGCGSNALPEPLRLVATASVVIEGESRAAAPADAGVLWATGSTAQLTMQSGTPDRPAWTLLGQRVQPTSRPATG